MTKMIFLTTYCHYLSSPLVHGIQKIRGGPQDDGGFADRSAPQSVEQ
jgi:hypothetical protein